MYSSVHSNASFESFNDFSVVTTASVAGRKMGISRGINRSSMSKVHALEEKKALKDPLQDDLRSRLPYLCHLASAPQSPFSGCISKNFVHDDYLRTIICFLYSFPVGISDIHRNPFRTAFATGSAPRSDDNDKKSKKNQVLRSLKAEATLP